MLLSFPSSSLHRWMPTSPLSLVWSFLLLSFGTFSRGQRSGIHAVRQGFGELSKQKKLWRSRRCWLRARQHAAALKAPITHSIKDESSSPPPIDKPRHVTFYLHHRFSSSLRCFHQPKPYFLFLEVTYSSLQSPASCDKLTCCIFYPFADVVSFLSGGFVFPWSDLFFRLPKFFLIRPLFQTFLLSYPCFRLFLDPTFVSDCHEREEDSQAPPELEPINLGEQSPKSKKYIVRAIFENNQENGDLSFSRNPFFKDVYSK